MATMLPLPPHLLLPVTVHLTLQFPSCKILPFT